MTPRAEPNGGRSTRRRAARDRWVSPRALLLHLAVVVIAPGCGLAGWWQATRALSGNTLSWFYSVEWPIFALLAIGGWWHLVHEDPAIYIKRRESARGEREARRRVAEPVATGSGILVDRATARAMAVAAVAVALEAATGVFTVFEVPFSRPAGIVPRTGAASFVLHGALGAALVIGAVVLVVRTRSAGRVPHFAAWAGLVGVSLAGVGGLLTAERAVVRFLGMGLMCVGPLLAGFSYALTALSRPSARHGSVPTDEPLQVR